MNGIIYKISNSVNDKVYIGQTIRGIDKRFNQHKIDSVNIDCHLYRAIRKYGFDNFVCEQIDSADSFDKLNELEIYHIKECDSYSHGYNMTLGGGGKSGCKHSEETKRKMSESKIGHETSEETRNKIRKFHKGNKYCINRKHSNDTKKKMSEYRKGNKYALGCSHPEDSKQIRSNSMKGLRRTSKLTEIQVKDIKTHLRDRTKTVKQLGEYYNVVIYTIYAIKTGRSWGYI